MRKSKARTRARLICAGSASAATAAAAVLVSATPAYAVTTATPATGVAGTTVTLSEAGLAVAAPGIQLRDATCASTTYATATSSIVNATNITKANASATTLTFTVPALGLGTNNASKTWNICVYASTTAGAALISSSSDATFTVYSNGSVSPATGASGGGNTITVNTASGSAWFTGITTPYAQFVTTAQCPATYTTPTSSIITAPVTKSAVTSTANTQGSIVVPAGVLGTAARTDYTICLYGGNSNGVSTLLGSSGTYSVTLPTVTLSPTTGPYNSASTGVVATSATSIFSSTSTLGATFTNAERCPPVYTATGGGNVAVASANVRKLANNRMAVTVPALPLTNSAATVYQACVYNGSVAGTSSILAFATYTSAILPNPVNVSPGAGPASGGTVVTITGTDFPTTAAGFTSVTLGGVPVTNITPLNSTAFTAVTPARPVQNDVALVITTSAGTKTLTAAFDYLNSVNVTPNTAPNTSPGVEVSVQGTGFMGLSFGSTAGTARVFLVNGKYDNTANAASTPGRANSPIQECKNVLTLTDAELVCTLPLNRRLNADANMTVFNPANYAPTAVADFVTTAGSPILTSATHGFTIKDLGQPITGTGLGTGAVIVKILSPTRIQVSANSTATATGITATVGNAAVRTQKLVTTADSNVVQAPTGSFTQADVGRVIGGVDASIPAGTTITSVSLNGGSATLSAPALISNNATGQTGLTIAAGSTSITAGGAFGSGDVGGLVVANNLDLPAGTFITAQGTTTATLSNPSGVGTSTGTLTVNRPVTASLYAAAPVPEGAYNLTVVSNGDVDASMNDNNYSQTEVSSGSTFTVSSF